jgi:two-component system NtrC family sensor kinase
VRLYQQLVLFMLAATVLPLAVVGFWLLRQSEAELGRRILAEHRTLGILVAQEAASSLIGAVDALGRATEAIGWAEATQDETRGALSLLYQQSSLVSAVALVDGEGALRAGPVFSAVAPPGRPAFSEAGVAAFLGSVPLGPLRAGQAGQAALGPAYAAAAAQGVRLGVAVKAGEGGDAPYVLAELGLDAVEATLVERAADGAVLELVDGAGRVVAAGAPDRRLVSLDPAVWSRLKEAPSGQPVVQLTAKGSWVTAVRVPESLGFWALVSVEEARALAPVAQMRRTVLVAVGAALFVLLALGAVFTRRLNRRIGTVVKGAEAYARGDLSHRLVLEGNDELTGLSSTFNQLGAELEVARGRLLRWNDDLRQKVDEATAELRAAQAQLVEAQKLAAVGQLGAGVAHEINNPLAGILGNAQLMMLDRDEKDPDLETLRKIELSARRCRDITQNLLRFSQQRDRPELRPVDLNGVVREALALTSHQLQGEGITVELALHEHPLRASADPGHLQQVLLAVVANARTAMARSDSRVLRIHSAVENGEVVLTVSDTGKGIPKENLARVFEPFFTTKDVWSNVGLGLSVAYRVMSEHQGRIDVHSEVGKGTQVTLRLPALPARASASQSAA